MGRKQKLDWDVRTNLGQSGGSQGTLFSGGKQWASPERFPKGYTPERRREVDSAFSLNNYKDGPARTEAARPDSNEHYRRVLDTVSRSTIPAEHLQPRLDDYARPHPLKIAGAEEGRELPAGTAAVHVSYPNDALIVPAGHPDHLIVHPDHTDDYMIVHELGHHHDIKTRQSGLGDNGNTRLGTVTHGKAEAYADAYAQEHYRSPQGEQFNVPTYPAIAARTTGAAFNTGYDIGRSKFGQPNPNLNTAQFPGVDMNSVALSQKAVADAKKSGPKSVQPPLF